MTSNNMVLHKIKRTIVGGMHARNEPKNPELVNLQQRLDNIEGALTKALNTIEKADKSWNNVAHSTVEFCQGLHTLYPADDDMRALFKDTLDETSALQEEVCGPETPGASSTSISEIISSNQESEGNVRKILRMIRGYLTEMKTLKREYSKVEVARMDFGMYQRKVERLERKENSSVEKTAKFLQLCQGAKASYFSILEGILIRMNSTFDKSPTMFRAVYTAYWLAQHRIHTAVSKHFHSAFLYATRNNERGLFQEIEPPTNIQGTNS